ncbi:hypothetical protein J2128_002239 [Methanomicrobium sp. W14]|uniref:hypothetical protein n=1 Tax=Methanomicrobium sp. W14 TaxID=2817839 RepID=UPI001AE1DEA5|nr:hypothetical protein [Methanomicrobium sp. W14]MBP2134273.1 hypothetical protein [Methanomicrobium sp. W14]
MKKRSVSLVFAVFFVLATVFLLAGCTETGDKHSGNAQAQNFTVASGHTCWSPEMSSRIGIDFTPELTGNTETIYHWTIKDTEQKNMTGFFLWDNSTGYKVTYLGDDAWTCGDRTVWWSCRNLNSDTLPDKFTLKVCAIDKIRNETVAETRINITRNNMTFCLE